MNFKENKIFEAVYYNKGYYPPPPKKNVFHGISAYKLFDSVTDRFDDF